MHEIKTQQVYTGDAQTPCILLTLCLTEEEAKILLGAPAPLAGMPPADDKERLLTRPILAALRAIQPK